MKLLLATRNRGKLVEMRQMLSGSGWEVQILPDFPEAPVIREDGRTFEENAKKKARSAAAFAGILALAEDAGLEVDALGGEPGIKSARYCGEGASDADRVSRVLHKMIAVPDEKRIARFRCVMCLADPDGTDYVFEGVCEGKIAHNARGSAGFGYDPIFIPEGRSLTFAEIGLAAKNRISHRAVALRKVIDYLKALGDAEASRRGQGA